MLIAAGAVGVPGASAQPASPRREFRGAWIATVANIDWPQRGAGAASQKQALVALLDRLRATGVNAVFFQVRSESDAMYRSDIEPWSYWLTGTQGQDPGFDPLAFAVEQAHLRGMELHAWMNPYQVERNLSGAYTTAPNHVSRTHPEWTMVVGNKRVLNPGLDAVSRYVAHVTADVVRRYDVDGIHFDDYFYFEGTTNQDQATYNAYLASTTGVKMNLGDWRRDNVNRMVAAVNDSVRAARASAQFGISPTGIRRNSDAGTSGYESYSAVYADGLAWLRAKTIDYIVPQVYWYIGKPAASYSKVVPWWASVATERFLYIGQPTYKIGTTEDVSTLNHTYTARDIADNLRFNRDYPNVRGSVMYNTTSVITGGIGRDGVADTLRRLWTPLAVPFSMPWKGDAMPPNAPTDVQWVTTLLDGNPHPNTHAVWWTSGGMAADGDTARWYGVYASAAPVTAASLADGSARLMTVVGAGARQATYAAASAPGAYVAVTAFDENWNESAPTVVVGNEVVEAPEAAVRDVLTVGPNPSVRGGDVRVSYALARAGRVEVGVYDVLGRRVAVLVDEGRSAGPHVAVWSSAGVTPGVYAVRLTSEEATATRLLIVR